MRKRLTYSTLSYLTVVLILSVTEACGQQNDISKILWTANWSHDNKYIAVGGVDKKIRIFSGKSFELLKLVGHLT